MFNGSDFNHKLLREIRTRRTSNAGSVSFYIFFRGGVIIHIRSVASLLIPFFWWLISIPTATAVTIHNGNFDDQIIHSSSSTGPSRQSDNQTRGIPTLKASPKPIMATRTTE